MSLPSVDRLLLGREALDREDRTEDLLADDPHLAADVGEDRRAVEEAGLEIGFVGAAAAGDEPGALGDGAGDVALDLRPVIGGDERAGLRWPRPVPWPSRIRSARRPISSTNRS